MRVHAQKYCQDDEEIHSLIRKYRLNPTKEMKNILVGQFSELVRRIAYRFVLANESKEDLYQVGIIGLLSALERFDPDVTHNFESYAIPTIIGEIKRYIRDKTWSVHVSRRIRELCPQIKKASQQLLFVNGEKPTVQEVAFRSR